MNRTHGWRAARPGAGLLVSLEVVGGWLNSSPLTATGMAGRVVLVDFWTYTCINWLRTLPYVRAWAQRYAEHGLVVVGVHTPEFDFEHDPDNVRRAVAAERVTYPVALDSDYAIWTAFDNHYWPALYLIDGTGQIRHHHFGEGGYARSEACIRQLLAETGVGGLDADPVQVDAPGREAPADWDSLWSPENYLGSDRSENLASSPARLRLNHWALSGDWTRTRRAVVLNQAEGLIAYRFHARDLHLVMAPATAGGPVRFRVRLDGQPPADAHGVDTDGDGNGTLTQARLYQLIRHSGPVSERTFDITFLDPGVAAYAFTFG